MHEDDGGYFGGGQQTGGEVNRDGIMVIELIDIIDGALLFSLFGLTMLGK